MGQLGRPGITSSEKADLWDRWKRGESLSDIARALSKNPGSIHGVLRGRGGIPPDSRKRSTRSLSTSEREEISRGISAGLGVRAIAGAIGRSPSTISRELTRNGGADAYRATESDQAAWDRSRRPKNCRLAESNALRKIVSEKLQLDWSPQQIAGWLKVQRPDDASMHLSHETIYRTLFVQSRGALRRELISHLRSSRMMRRPTNASLKGKGRGKIIDAVSIRERPAEIEDRAVPGHWEGDLLSGAGNTHIATLVERASRYTILVKVDGKDTASVIAGLKREVKKLPLELRKTLTWDRGMELASHKTFSLATKVDVYFADPQSPWQRGTNENTNGLLRQYFPDGTRLDQFGQRDLNTIARKLNGRPRKTLQYQTPNAKLAILLR